MGLFGLGSSFSRIGGGAEGRAAHKIIEDIAGGIEMELHDTPGEYFALQTGGMLFASQANAVGGVKPVRSMGESLARAAQIMTAFSNQSSIETEVLKAKAKEVYDSLCAAAAKGTNSALLVGQLNDYLHLVDSTYLEKRRAANFVPQTHQASERSHRWWQFWES